MGENSRIEWTDHTFNPWSGCQKISPGCQHCYAEVQAKRNPTTLGVWGPQGTRVRMNAAYWRKPIKWNNQVWEECVDCGWRGPHSETHDFCPVCDGETLLPTRQRVFCASMSDVFEDRPELLDWRVDLLRLIEQTWTLDWLLLTKRPENVVRMIEEAQSAAGAEPCARGWLARFSNVWIGTTVENQEAADKRIPALLKVPARVRFLSCEPLLGELGLLSWMALPGQEGKAEWFLSRYGTSQPISWVIAGAESGHDARAMNLD